MFYSKLPWRPTKNFALIRERIDSGYYRKKKSANDDQWFVFILMAISVFILIKLN